MPYLGSTVFFASSIAALAVALNAWWLATRALAPEFVERSREQWSSRPVLTVLLGGVTGGFATIVCIVLLSIDHAVAKLAGSGLAMCVLAFALCGTAGLAARIGRGLASPSDEGREWFQSLKGGAVLELTFLLPFLGWFVLLPIAVYGGLGAAIVALVRPLFASIGHARPA